jgi:hypothetical protein
MKGVLRLAAGFLALVPLQKWLSILGSTLLFAGLLIQGDLALAFCVLGMALLALVPALVGGIALRVVASAGSFRLRPRGALTLMAGATLCIVLLALLGAAVAVTIAPTGARTVQGFALAFGFGWSVLTLAWTVTFVISGSGAMFGLFIVAMSSLQLLPRPSASAADITTALMLISAAGWVILGIHIARSRLLRTPGWSAASLSRAPRRAAHPGSALTPRATRSAALRAYLIGSPALAPYLLALPLSAVFVLWQRFAGQGGFPLLLFIVVAPLSATFADLAMRRARFVWLRPGFDRASLYRRTERTALTGLLVLWLAIMTPPLALALWQPDGSMGITLRHATLNLCLALCINYYVLMQVRGWTFQAIAGAAVLAPLWLACLFAPLSLVAESRFAGALLPALLVLIAVFRVAGPLRWRRIDWLLLRPTGVQGRTT